MNNFDSQEKGDILIVDDVPENLKLLFTMLTEQGYDVRRVLSGKQALKAIDFDPPDLILLDIKMPEMDGYQVCEYLKKNQKTQDIPVIFLSALNDTFDKIKAFESGGVDYINKPFQLQEVVIRVKNQFSLLKMNRKIKQKNHELENLNEELETFSYSVSHDLRNPLTNINGLSYLLKEKYSDKLESKAQEMLEEIYNSSLKMATIIDDLLRLAKLNYEETNFNRLNLSEIVKEIVSIFNKDNPDRNIEFIIEDNLIVKGDENLLKLALTNLLNNACQYTSKNQNSRIEFGKISDKSGLIYFIKDNGIGFESSKNDRLFTPFTRFHSEKEFSGNGIGLSIVKKIIQLHGGNIWCESQPDQGATFYFTLK